MNSKEYVQLALRTEAGATTEVKVNDALLFEQVVQAFIASANLLDMYKKNIYYGKPINPQKWLENAIVLHDAGFELENADFKELPPVGDPLTINSRILHASIGIATEAGEIMEAVYKAIVQGVSPDEVNLAEEIGDLNWYEAIMVDVLGADWDEIRERNIAKLRKRYPEKFTSENALKRDLEGERKILEGSHEHKQCDTCHGQGTIAYIGDDHGHYGWTEQCGDCNGRGYYN